MLEGIIGLSVARTPLNLESVDSLPLGREPMLAVSAPPDALPGEGDLPLEALLGRPLILYRRYEELVMSAFRRRNLAPDILCVCDDARTAIPWVEAGLATAVFPRSMQGQCAGLSVRLLSEPEGKRGDGPWQDIRGGGQPPRPEGRARLGGRAGKSPP